MAGAFSMRNGVMGPRNPPTSQPGTQSTQRSRVPSSLTTACLAEWVRDAQQAITTSTPSHCTWRVWVVALLGLLSGAQARRHRVVGSYELPEHYLTTNSPTETRSPTAPLLDDPVEIIKGQADAWYRGYTENCVAPEGFTNKLLRGLGNKGSPVDPTAPKYLLERVILGSPEDFAHTDYVQRRATCMDGSPAGYYMRRGFLDGVNKWLVHFEGANFCYLTLREHETGPVECSFHLAQSSATSYCWRRYMFGGGFLSANRTENPEFHSWNVVVVKHCDGGLSNPRRTDPIPEHTLSNAGAVGVKRRKIHAIVDSVLKAGMQRAQRVLVSGCAHEGFGAIHQCDAIEERLVASGVPGARDLRCVPYAGSDVCMGDGVERLPPGPPPPAPPSEEELLELLSEIKLSKQEKKARAQARRQHTLPLDHEYTRANLHLHLQRLGPEGVQKLLGVTEREFWERGGYEQMGETLLKNLTYTGAPTPAMTSAPRPKKPHRNPYV